MRTVVLNMYLKYMHWWWTSIPLSHCVSSSGASAGLVPPLTAVHGLWALAVRLTFRLDLVAVPSHVFCSPSSSLGLLRVCHPPHSWHSVVLCCLLLSAALFLYSVSWCTLTFSLISAIILCYLIALLFIISIFSFCILLSSTHSSYSSSSHLLSYFYFFNKRSYPVQVPTWKWVPAVGALYKTSVYSFIYIQFRWSCGCPTTEII